MDLHTSDGIYQRLAEFNLRIMRDCKLAGIEQAKFSIAGLEILVGKKICSG